MSKNSLDYSDAASCFTQSSKSFRVLNQLLVLVCDRGLKVQGIAAFLACMFIYWTLSYTLTLKTNGQDSPIPLKNKNLMSSNGY